jgi:prepilin-type N-terminal cleavage/methylation domain-containing protein
MKARIHQATRAFTLLEIMVALAMLAVIVVAIYSCWYSIVKGSAVAAKAAAAGQRTRMAMQTVQDALLSACMYAQNQQYYSFVVDSEGDYSSLSFTAHLPGSFLRSRKFGGAEIRRLNFTIEPGPDSKKQLVLRQNVLLMDPDQDETENPLVLARDVNQFIVEFTDPNTGDWTSDWVNTNQLPKKVRVTLTLGDKFSDKPQESMVGTVALIAQPVQGVWQMPVGGVGMGGLGAGAPGQGQLPGGAQGGQQQQQQQQQQPGVGRGANFPGQGFNTQPGMTR